MNHMSHTTSASLHPIMYHYLNLPLSVGLVLLPTLLFLSAWGLRPCPFP